MPIMGLFAARTKAGNAFGYEKAPAPTVKRGAGALGFSTRPLGWGRRRSDELHDLRRAAGLGGLRVLEVGHELRLLRLGQRHVTLLDVAVTADVVRHAGELDRDREIVAGQLGTQVVEQAVVVLDRLALHVTLLGLAEDV